MGIKEICREIGIKPNFLLASDRDIFAKKVYVKNFNPKLFLCSDFKFLIDYDADKNLLMSSNLNGLKSKIDLFLAGPPCEGNSNLNNKTRGNDPRNNLFFDILNFFNIDFISNSKPGFMTFMIISVVSFETLGTINLLNIFLKTRNDWNLEKEFTIKFDLKFQFNLIVLILFITSHSL